MAKLTVDTNEDTIEDLQHAIEMIQKALDRRNVTAAEMVTVAEEKPTAERLVGEASKHEAAIEIPGLRISIGDSSTDDGPTINDLLSNESITEDDLQELYKHVPEAQVDARKHHETESNEEVDILKTPEEDNNSFIEIVEYEDEEKD